jgi:hypothetical protein
MKFSSSSKAILTAVVAALSVFALSGQITVQSVAQAAIAGLGALLQVKPAQ